MRAQELSRGLRKILIGATALALSLVLLLGPAQNSFAKNYPRPVPWRQSANTAIGTADGGGGAGDVFRRDDANGKLDPQTYTYGNGKISELGNVSGVIVFERNISGYYEIVLEILKTNLFLMWSETLTPNSAYHEK